jgi:hypothetical protein
MANKTIRRLRKAMLPRYDFDVAEFLSDVELSFGEVCVGEVKQVEGSTRKDDNFDPTMKLETEERRAKHEKQTASKNCSRRAFRDVPAPQRAEHNGVEAKRYWEG